MANRDAAALPVEHGFSMILQGTLDSDSAREEFQRAFSSVGLQALSENYGSRLIRALWKIKTFCLEAGR